MHVRIRGFCQILLSVSEDGFNLFTCYAGKPCKELIDRGSSFKVLEQSLNWYTGSFKDQCSTNFVIDPLNFRASTPIQHGVHGMLAPLHHASSCI